MSFETREVLLRERINEEQGTAGMDSGAMSVCNNPFEAIRLDAQERRASVHEVVCAKLAPNASTFPTAVNVAYGMLYPDADPVHDYFLAQANDIEDLPVTLRERYRAMCTDKAEDRIAGTPEVSGFVDGYFSDTHPDATKAQRILGRKVCALSRREAHLVIDAFYAANDGRETSSYNDVPPLTGREHGLIIEAFENGKQAVTQERTS